jgi:hypothetical protein
MRRARLGAVLLAALAALPATTTGCFNPAKPACAFSCAEAPKTCPAGYLCGGDNFCHDPSSTAICVLNLGEAGVNDGDGGGDAGVVSPDAPNAPDGSADRGQ